MSKLIIQIAHDAINSINAIHGLNEVELDYLVRHEDKDSCKVYELLLERIMLTVKHNLTKNDQFIYDLARDSMIDVLEPWDGSYLIESMEIETTYYSLLSRIQQTQIAAVIIAAKSFYKQGAFKNVDTISQNYTKFLL